MASSVRLCFYCLEFQTIQDPEYAPSTKKSKPQTFRNSYQSVYNTSTKQKEHLVVGSREEGGGGRSSRTCSIQQWNFRIRSTTTDGDQPVADFVFL